MKLRFMKALNRHRMRRSIASERAVLKDMRDVRDNYDQQIDAQATRVTTLEQRLTGHAPTARDIARDIERNAKAPLLA